MMAPENNGKIRWQCRRGMLELDILLERFLNQHFAQLTDQEKEVFIQLLNQSDATLYQWIFNQPDVVPAPYREIILQIKQTPSS